MYSLTILCLSVTLPYVYFYSMHYTIESISNILYSIVEYLDSMLNIDSMIIPWESFGYASSTWWTPAASI